jgi:uncharacterized membrane protein
MADKVTRELTVKGSVDEIYEIWANFENFPHFMNYIKSVTKTGERTSHWVMKGPLGKDIEWDADTTTLERGTRIAWNSRDGGDIKTSGQVTFTQLPNNQTQITATVQYVPPAGKLGEAIAHLFTDPEKRLEQDLNNFKAYVEGTRSPAVTA